eukprot:gb/GFBE01053937.1/.p1 GENE.gb/GFBE01053937.1/~~gb/GFBE01053937.1/.p1  ORF type:complete len:384 (+),score=91.67 gb/GFBE01053937.1/:1-1152(+)
MSRRQEKPMSDKDWADLAWVDDWVLEDSGRQKYSPDLWKEHFFGLSKTLSYLLRHGAWEQGLDMRKDGFVWVDDFLKLRQYKAKGYTEEDVKVCVARNAKKRFQWKVEDGSSLVRASQGHTDRVGDIDQEQICQVITLADVPPLAIHGTFRNLMEAIRKQGLKTMGRDHIHMATGMPSESSVISGCREGTDTFMRIDVKRAIEGGIKFLRAANDVILTPGRNGVLPSEYIMGAVDAKGKVLFGNPEMSPAGQRDAVTSEGKGTPAGTGRRWMSGRGSAGAQQGYASTQSAPAAPSAPPAANAPAKQSSELSATEKEFMRVAKKVREVLKLEDEASKGTKLDGPRNKKLEGKEKLLQELREADSRLPEASNVREKNPDVMKALK